MPMSDQQTPTPEQVFLHVQHKVENGYEYPIAEAKIDFTRLFHALHASLRTNSATEARLYAAEALLEEREIELFNKELELFNAMTQFDYLKDTK